MARCAGQVVWSRSGRIEWDVMAALHGRHGREQPESRRAIVTDRHCCAEPSGDTDTHTETTSLSEA